MDLDRFLERTLRDPEKRVKIYIAFNLGIILVNIFIVLGLVILLVRYARFI